MAITSSHRRGSHLMRRVRRQHQRPPEYAREQRCGGHCPTIPRRLVASKQMHGTMLRAVPYKTDSAARLNIPLLGSWNSALRQTRRGIGVAFPIQFLEGSKLKFGDKFGASAVALCSAKYLLINDLVGFRLDSDIGATRALVTRMSAFQMTGWEERRARGKGLAHHFSQFVPTCL